MKNEIVGQFIEENALERPSGGNGGLFTNKWQFPNRKKANFQVFEGQRANWRPLCGENQEIRGKMDCYSANEGKYLHTNDKLLEFYFPF